MISVIKSVVRRHITLVYKQHNVVFFGNVVSKLKVHRKFLTCYFQRIARHRNNHFLSLIRDSASACGSKRVLPVFAVAFNRNYVAVASTIYYVIIPVPAGCVVCISIKEKIHPIRTCRVRNIFNSFNVKIYVL